MLKFALIGGGILALILLVGYINDQSNSSGSAKNSIPIENETNSDLDIINDIEQGVEDNNATNEAGAVTHIAQSSSRQVFMSEAIILPLAGSAPVTNVKHSIPIEEIRRGCFMQDCIPSVDNPVFISVQDANDLLPNDTIGISLSYKGEERFYPFNMLVTREIVNGVVAGDPLLVTYCPLCGTGIVFDRTVDGVTYEFGVSGMLWQSNLLMYNRAENIADRNLWSQVLGEAVVGNKTGTKLQIIPSDIVRYTNWAAANPGGKVLNTGRIGDPYGGNYYGVARNFAPSFNESDSPLDSSVYVYGIEVDGQFKAYPRDELPVGITNDEVGNTSVTITKSVDGLVVFTDASGMQIADVEGFWFSWIAAHPESALWREN